MKKILYLLCFAIAIISCSKEEELSDKQMLANPEGKKWVISEVTLDSADVTSTIEPCVLDNERIFYSDNSFELTEGDTICNGQEDVTANGTWQFNDVKTTLKIAIGTDTTEYIVKELYKNKMRVFFIDQATGSQYNWKLIPK